MLVQIAVGILKNMDGDLGHASWRWLFYIEGALTIAVAAIAVPILPDFPLVPFPPQFLGFSSTLTARPRHFARLATTPEASPLRSARSPSCA
jgi:MFS family permease